MNQLRIQADSQEQQIAKKILPYLGHGKQRQPDTVKKTPLSRSGASHSWIRPRGRVKESVPHEHADPRGGKNKRPEPRNAAARRWGPTGTYIVETSVLLLHRDCAASVPSAYCSGRQSMGRR